MTGPADLLLKHLIAQQTKDFFGYGPKGRAAAVLQERVAVFQTELRGPGLIAALAPDPFGRLQMRQINRLYVGQTAEALRRLAEERFGLRLLAVESDIDFRAGLSLGVAIGDRNLPAAEAAGPAPAPLAAAVAQALGVQAEVRLGRSLLVAGGAVAVAPAPPPGASAEETFAHLRAWDALRTELGDRLAAAGGRCGLRPRGTFVVPAGPGILVGLLLGE